MEAWKDVINNVVTILSVVLGWGLGIWTAAVSERRRERKKLSAIRQAIALELREIAHRLLIVMYKVAARNGGLDREFYAWMLPQIERYAGPNPKEGFLKGFRGLLSRSDAELAQVAAIEKASTPPQFIPTEEALYTASAMGEAHDFEPDFAVRALDVLSHLRMFNETVLNARYFSEITFRPGLSAQNHANAVAGGDEAERRAGHRARVVVKKISQLEDRFSAQPALDEETKAKGALPESTPATPAIPPD